MDDLGSEGAIFAKCQEAMLAGRLPELKERMQKEGHLAMEQILEVQMQGDDEVNAIIDQAIGYLGIALANVVNLINPGYVVADSCLFSVEKNRQRLLEAAKGNFFGLNEEEVQIVDRYLEKYQINICCTELISGFHSLLLCGNHSAVNNLYGIWKSFFECCIL